MFVKYREFEITCTVEEFLQLQDSLSPAQPAVGVTGIKQSNEEPLEKPVTKTQKRNAEKKRYKLRQRAKQRDINLKATTKQQQELLFNPFWMKVTGALKTKAEMPTNIKAWKDFYHEKIRDRMDFLSKNYPDIESPNHLSFGGCLNQFYQIEAERATWEPRYTEYWYDAKKQLEAGDFFNPSYPKQALFASSEAAKFFLLDNYRDQGSITEINWLVRDDEQKYQLKTHEWVTGAQRNRAHIDRKLRDRVYQETKHLSSLAFELLSHDFHKKIVSAMNKGVNRNVNDSLTEELIEQTREYILEAVVEHGLVQRKRVKLLY